MRSWLILLAGLLLWAAHFFLVYGIGEFGGEGPGSHLWVGGLTLLCLLGTGGLAVLLLRLPRSEPYEAWRNRSALAGVALGAIAIAWQGLPALFAG